MGMQWNLAQNVLRDMADCAAEVERLLCFDDQPDEVAQILSLVRASTGKQMRPALLFLSAQFGPDYQKNKKQLCHAAALIELVHTASLIHDDIVDDSPTRRANPTVQAAFGKDMAVFTGDLLLSRVMEQAIALELPHIGRCIAQTIHKMCMGELCQKAAMYDKNATEQNYMAAIDGKTSALFVAACHCGAEQSGCTAEQTQALCGFGQALGRLFQMRDDLLDFQADAAVLGKPAHQDFANGIFTLPVLCALHNENTRAAMQQAIELIKTAPQNAREQMLEAVADANGLGCARARMEACGKTALQHLAKLPETAAREQLQQAACLLLPV